MDYHFNTRLNGCIALTDSFDANPALLQDKNLYKFIWVEGGMLHLLVDHIPVTLMPHEMICLNALHHIDFIEQKGNCIALLFNSNFYCIFGHTKEVSCNGFLFSGSNNLKKLRLDAGQLQTLRYITRDIISEKEQKDNLQEEMLRTLLKRFIITCTRIARDQYITSEDKDSGFELVRQYYVLVEKHFKEKKQVQEYADELNRSPKTLSNLFATYGLPSPLRIIHERIEAEAKRLLLYTSKSAKEIADILGFEDPASFSRFFKKMAGESISSFKERNKG